MGEDVGRALPEQEGGAVRAQSGSGVGARSRLMDPPPEGARSLSLSVGLGGCRAKGGRERPVLSIFPASTGGNTGLVLRAVEAKRAADPAPLHSESGCNVSFPNKRT